jgi:hypothetical protein
MPREGYFGFKDLAEEDLAEKCVIHSGRRTSAAKAGLILKA